MNDLSDEDHSDHVPEPTRARSGNLLPAYLLRGFLCSGICISAAIFGQVLSSDSAQAHLLLEVVCIPVTGLLSAICGGLFRKDQWTLLLTVSGSAIAFLRPLSELTVLTLINRPSLRESAVTAIQYLCLTIIHDVLFRRHFKLKIHAVAALSVTLIVSIEIILHHVMPYLVGPGKVLVFRRTLNETVFFVLMATQFWHIGSVPDTGICQARNSMSKKTDPANSSDEIHRGAN